MAFPTVTVTPGSGQTVNTLPNAGQTTSANSLPVVIASDQSTVHVSTVRTVTNYSIAGGSVTGSSQTAVTAGQAAVYLCILNPSANTGTVYVDPAGGTASSTNGIPLIPGAQFELAGGVANAVTLIGTATQPIQIWGGV